MENRHMTAAQHFREEGIAQSKNDLTVNCLKEGVSIEFIAKVIDLPIEQIKAIAKEHQLD